MKSLSDNYTSAHANTHETFADLVFCALVVLILFVLALTVEVSQRVRSIAQVTDVDKVEVEEIVKLSPEEMERLSARLQAQQTELKELREKLVASEKQVQNKMAALAGEQRFTGAREPASIAVAYDYRKELIYFVSAKDIDEADTRNSGESDVAYLLRKRNQLAEIAVLARTRQRGYTLVEAKAIYSSLSQYRMIVPTPTSYQVETESVGINYHITLCEYVAGDVQSTIDHEPEIVRAILEVFNVKGRESEDMYPSCSLVVDTASRQISIGGVAVSARELRDILLSASGRGLLLDMQGYQGKIPGWLYEGALVPAGYVAKTPKMLP